MAVLTSTGINFSDGTSASSRNSFGFPSGTVSLFYRASAPTGWTAVTGQNNKMLRLVNTGGGSASGTNAFSNTLTNRPASQTVTVSVTANAGPVTLSVNTIPSHSHPANNGGNSSAAGGGGANVVNPGSSTGNYGNSGAHTHPVSTTASGPWSASVDMRVQYCDVILCTWGG